MSKALKSALIFLGSAVLVLSALEVFLVQTRGRPAEETEPEYIRFAFKEVLKPFFAKDEASGVYRSVRPKSSPSGFRIQKGPRELRVFIVGESVAQFYPGPGKTLEKLLPDREISVVNCGVGSYDSERALGVLREVLDYGPDCLIVLSGNNEFYEDGGFNPRLYDLGRKLERFWIFRIVSAQLAARKKKLTRDQLIDRYCANMRKMAALAASKKVPALFVTLPVNLHDYFPDNAEEFPHDREFVAGWCAYLDGRPDRAYAFLQSYLQKTPASARAKFFLARTLEAQGRTTEAAAYYRELGDKDPFRSSEKQNAFLRTLAAPPFVHVADMRREFEELCAPALPGFDLFVDECHWRTPLYRLLDEEVARLLASEAAQTAAALSPFKIEDARTPEELERILANAVATAFMNEDFLSESCVIALRRVRLEDPELFNSLGGASERVRQKLAAGLYSSSLAEPESFEPGWTRLMFNYAEALRREKRYPEALVALNTVESRGSGVKLSHVNLLRALVLRAMGDTAQAATQARRALWRKDGDHELAEAFSPLLVTTRKK